MAIPLKSEDCRLKAEEAEMMARTLSFKPDRDRYSQQAREWRTREAAALSAEGEKPQGGKR